eukprot:4382275-Prymnesium_polylepis.2
MTVCTVSAFTISIDSESPRIRTHVPPVPPPRVDREFARPHTSNTSHSGTREASACMSALVGRRERGSHCRVLPLKIQRPPPGGSCSGYGSIGAPSLRTPPLKGSTDILIESCSLAWSKRTDPCGCSTERRFLPTSVPVSSIQTSGALGERDSVVNTVRPVAAVDRAHASLRHA